MFVVPLQGPLRQYLLDPAKSAILENGRPRQTTMMAQSPAFSPKIGDLVQRYIDYHTWRYGSQVIC